MDERSSRTATLEEVALAFLAALPSEVRKEQQLPLNRFAGRSGVVIEATRLDYTNRIVIQLDGSDEKVVVKDDNPIGFVSELEAVRKALVGKALWTRSAYVQMTPTSDPCGRLKADDYVTLKSFQRISITQAEFFRYEETIARAKGKLKQLDACEAESILTSLAPLMAIERRAQAKSRLPSLH